MSKRKRVVDPALLPHERPCRCAECRSAYGRIWRAAKPEYMDQWFADHPRECITCGGSTGGHTRRYCSDACRRGGSNHSTRIGYCVECSSVFPKGRTNRTRCDEHFVGNNNKPVERVEMECRWCFSMFSGTAGKMSSGSGCCSSSCRGKLAFHYYAHNAPDRCHLPLCTMCGLPTGEPPPSQNPGVKRRETGVNQMRCPSCKSPEYRSGRAPHRRAAERKSVTKPTVAKLAERDGWSCHLCRKPINPDLTGTKSKYKASVDHLIPLADGGEDEMYNCKLAHLRCNATRGTRGVAQLLLVG